MNWRVWVVLLAAPPLFVLSAWTMGMGGGAAISPGLYVVGPDQTGGCTLAIVKRPGVLETLERGRCAVLPELLGYESATCGLISMTAAENSRAVYECRSCLDGAGRPDKQCWSQIRAAHTQLGTTRWRLLNAGHEAAEGLR